MRTPGRSEGRLPRIFKSRRDMLLDYMTLDVWDHPSCLAATARRDSFRRALRFLLPILRADPTLHPSLVRLIGQPVQTRYLTFSVTMRKEHRASFPWLAGAELLFGQSLRPDERPFARFPWLSPDDDDLSLKSDDQSVTVSLASDIILPWPWEPDRLSSAIGLIGTGREDGPWTFHPLNHKVLALWPLRVALVHGGNHSITAGILAREGSLPADLVDVTPWLKRFSSRGYTFYDRTARRNATKQPSLWWALLWELGRVIVQEGLNVPPWQPLRTGPSTNANPTE